MVITTALGICMPNASFFVLKLRASVMESLQLPFFFKNQVPEDSILHRKIFLLMFDRFFIITIYVIPFLCKVFKNVSGIWVVQIEADLFDCSVEQIATEFAFKQVLDVCSVCKKVM